MIAYLIPAVVAFFASFLTTPLIIRFAKQLRLVDDPKKRFHPAHTHTGIIPRAGGLALLVGFLMAVGLFLPITKQVLGIITASIVTVGIGLLDDRKDLSPYVRLLGNIACAMLVVAGGIGVPFITHPFGGVLELSTWRISFSFFGTHSFLFWADIFAIIWIVWTMNIVGWSSGVDGQMPGFVAISALVLGIFSLRFTAHDVSQTIVTILAFVTAGTFLGFLPWNFYPQKIMPGYGGKTLAGLLLATLAILSGGKVGSMLLLLAIPMTDAVYTLFRRIVAKKSPFRGDRYHLHHRLLDLGWGKRRIALFYWVVSLILGIVVLLLDSRHKFFVLAMIFTVIVGMLYGISQLLTKNKSIE